MRPFARGRRASSQQGQACGMPVPRLSFCGKLCPCSAGPWLLGQRRTGKESGSWFVLVTAVSWLFLPLAPEPAALSACWPEGPVVGARGSPLLIRTRWKGSFPPQERACQGGLGAAGLDLLCTSRDLGNDLLLKRQACFCLSHFPLRMGMCSGLLTSGHFQPTLCCCE